MKKKRFSKILLSLAMVGILCTTAACSGNDEYVTSNKTTETTTTNSDRVTIYTYVDPDNEDLHYDQDTKFYYPLLDMVHMYNNYCTLNHLGKNSVNVVKFSSRDRMIQQMSTEIMAGEGPDIIVLDNELPISKLINQGAFADLNQLIENDNGDRALNLDDYNEDLLNTGVFKGKRYMMPMLIEPDIYISNSALFEDYNITENTNLTYTNLEEKLKKFENSNSDISLTDSYSSSKEIVLQYINDNIDKETYETNFDSKEFKTTIQSLKKLVTKSVANEKDVKNLSESECLFSKGTMDEETGIYSLYNFSLNNMSSMGTDTFSYDDVSDEQLENYAIDFYTSEDFDPLNGQKNNEKLFFDYVYGKEKSNFEDKVNNSIQTTFIDGITTEENQSRGLISCGFMINNNSDKKDKAYEFIKYSMGERMQRFISYDSNYGETYNIPVNQEAFKNACSGFMNIEDSIEELEKREGFTEKYATHILKLNTFEIRDGYYNDKVIGSLVDDYLQDNISLDNFISNLNSKTKIYLYE